MSAYTADAAEGLKASSLELLSCWDGLLRDIAVGVQVTNRIKNLKGDDRATEKISERP
jgi:hypothetical protein